MGLMNMSENLINFEVFHGTEKQRGLRFIKNQIMDKSIGDKHWLGDGAYFYEKVTFAYKWIQDMFKYRQYRKHTGFDDLIDKYIILFCNIEVDNNRIFNLDDNIDHKCIFEYFGSKLEESKKYSERFSRYKIGDGVVLNIMFSEYKYINNYDAVIASFVTKQYRYKDSNTRLNYVLEKQICVKNLNIVYDIKEHDFKDEYEHIDSLVKILNESKKVDMYSIKRKNYSKNISLLKED